MQEQKSAGKKEKNIRESPDGITSPECFMFKSFPYRTISCLNTNFLFGWSLCTFESRREGSGFQLRAFIYGVHRFPPVDPHREF